MKPLALVQKLTVEAESGIAAEDAELAKLSASGHLQLRSEYAEARRSQMAWYRGQIVAAHGFRQSLSDLLAYSAQGKVKARQHIDLIDHFTQLAQEAGRPHEAEQYGAQKRYWQGVLETLQDMEERMGV